jgi:hypothetical protein
LGNNSPVAGCRIVQLSDPREEQGAASFLQTLEESQMLAQHLTRPARWCRLHDGFGIRPHCPSCAEATVVAPVTSALDFITKAYLLLRPAAAAMMVFG